MRIQKGRKDPQNKIKKFNAGCSLLRAEGFFCSLEILHGGLVQFLVNKTLDPDWIWIRIGMQPKMLDSDPYQISTGPKHWFLLIPKGSIVDGHRFDADPDLTSHFDANPDPDRYESESYPIFLHKLEIRTDRRNRHPH
jgi:hypothetical protein